MNRFVSNRWWVFVLALAFFLVCAFLISAQAPRVAYATQILGEGPAEPPQPGIGDPDVPITPGQPGPGRAIKLGGATSGVVQRPSLEGERVTPVSVWTIRLRLYLMGLRIRLLL